MALISVIVPVYKVEPYLRECVESILNQTFSDFELILVDDGSPDKCPDICDEYAKKDSRVIVIHKQNGGLSSARNVGLDYVFRYSTSKYITFVDSDDFLEPPFLNTMVNRIKEFDMAICCYYDFNDASSEKKVNHILDGVFDSLDYWRFNYATNRIPYIVAWGKLYKRELFKGIRYPVGKNHEDEFVIHRIVFECNKICVIDECLYNYRNRRGSIMSNLIGTKEEKILRINIYVDRFIFLYANGIEAEFEYNVALGLISSIYFKYPKQLKSFYIELKRLYSAMRHAVKNRFNAKLFFIAPRFYSFIKYTFRRAKF